jgi:UPF0755 protein
MKYKYKILIILLVLIIIVPISLYKSGLEPKNKEKGKEIIRIELPLGSSVDGIANQLEQNGVIKSARVFKIYSKLQDIGSKYRAGIYYLDSGMSIEEITEIIQHGKGFVEIVRFTIPEGYEVRMIVDKLAELGLGESEKFHEIINNHEFDYDFLKDLPENAVPMEGYLFPDTYEVYKAAKEEEIIKKMLDRFDDVFTKDYKKRAQELNMTINEVVTLASIIEREAKAEKELKVVSSVFHNRLKINMLLGSCATVQYIIKERKDVLLTKDLEVVSPFNTYKNPGLPPGPIASPGKKSIEAALYPDETDYLYFVAEKDGTHYFSKTYDEHLRAQRRINGK